MKKVSNIYSLAAVCLFASLASQAVAEYEYRSIDYPGAEYTQVFSINNQGQVAGNATIGPDSYAFVYETKNGKFSNLALIQGYDRLGVFEVSEAGKIAGYVSDGLVSDTGLLIDRDGNALLFDHPNADSITRARGLNNSGLIAGARDSVDNQGTLLEGLTTNGFVYDTKTGTFVDTVESARTIAQGIDSKGNVVGSGAFIDPLVANPCPSLGIAYSWLWSNGTATYFGLGSGLDPLPTMARGIRDNGDIVGWYSDNTLQVIRSFVARLDGSQCQSIGTDSIDIIDFPGAILTYAQGINNAGVVSGSYEDANGSHGFVAIPR